MSPAIVLSLCVATLNLATAVVHLAIARAPGWRAGRAFSLVALSAGCYSLGNIVFCVAGLPDVAYVAGGRWNYLWVGVHVLAWILVAFGGPEASLRALSRPLRTLVAVGAAATLFFAATGLHLGSAVRVVVVPWAHVTYHYPLTTPVGDWFGTALFALLCVPFAQLVRRRLRGERALTLMIVGFVLFLLSALVELLVANGLLVFVSPADLGFLAVVAPTSLQMLRRFIDDSRRLNELSGRLAGEVRDRTEERDRAETALLEAERLASLGRLAAGVGHEINNPLTYLQLALDRVGEHLRVATAPPEVREAFADAVDGTTRIRKVVEGLRTYSRRADERRPLDPVELVQAALKVSRPHLRHVAQLETVLGATPRVQGDEARLVQALVNLLVNAAQAVNERHGSGHITVRTRSEAGDRVVLEVEDDGPGIAEEHRAHLAEPYFTTRGPRGGLGLGLFVTRGIVDAHGGRLELDSAATGGTCARIVLPAIADGPDAAPSASAPASPRGAAVAADRRPRLLVVDDEPLVLRMLTRVLSRDWDVTGVAGGAEALERLVPGAFDRVICDLMMPGLSGMELADEVARRDPALRERMLFLTGGAVTAEAQAFLDRADVVHLVKPVELAALDAALRGPSRPASSR